MPASKEQQWKPEEDQIIREHVKQGKRLNLLRDVLVKRTMRGIYCRVYELGLKSGVPKTRYSKDETFWETPNPLNCYYAGVLAADGCVHEKLNAVSWVASTEDEQYMEMFRQAVRYTAPISHHTRVTRKGTESRLSRVYFNLCDKWRQDLASNFNILPQKSYRLTPPSLASDLLLCCYLIGYTDGDGCISFTSTAKSPTIRYCSASPHIIRWIKNFTDRHFSFQMRVKERSVSTSANGNYHSYVVYGMSAVKMFEFLRTIDVPKFSRKWDNPAMLEAMAEYRTKWPEYFAAPNLIAFDEQGNLPVRPKKNE